MNNSDLFSFPRGVIVMGYHMKEQLRGVRQQERVGDYCVSMKQSLHNSATESRGLEHVATFLIS